METDHFLKMGHSHKVCEDYAASSSAGVWPGQFAVVSDGCSLVLDANGKPFNAYTDYGSRLMVRAASDILREGFPDQQWVHRMILSKAEVFARALGFPRQTLSATLLTVQVQEQSFLTTVCGDGVTAARRKGSSIWDVQEFSFSDGKPYYMRYDLSKDDRTTFNKTNQYCVREDYTVDTDNFGLKVPFATLLEIPPTGIFFTQYEYPFETHDIVLVSTDGMTSFTHRKEDTTIEPIPTPMALNEYLALKGTKGEFIQRRAKKASAALEKAGITHHDDISIAALALES